MARKLDIDPAHLSRIERGLVFPSLCVLARLADVLGISYGLAVETLEPTFGYRLRESRERAAISAERLAHMLGVDTQELLAVENGAHPAPGPLRTKAELLLAVDSAGQS